MLVGYFNQRVISTSWVKAIVALSFVVLFTADAARAQQPFMTMDRDQLRGKAWWVIAEFHPFTKEVRGIPANKIDKNWCKATELRKDLLPKDIVMEGGRDSLEGYSFALEGNFDGSASKQVALVGVYEDCTGKTWHFFMILDQPAVGQQPKVRFLSVASPDPHAFAALTVKDNEITVWGCMDCDNTSTLKWDRKRRKFVWLPNPVE
jgi:hypothetical protein